MRAQKIKMTLTRLLNKMRVEGRKKELVMDVSN
jgi:hypothetical protein